MSSDSANNVMLRGPRGPREAARQLDLLHAVSDLRRSLTRYERVFYTNPSVVSGGIAYQNTRWLRAARESLRAIDADIRANSQWGLVRRPLSRAAVPWIRVIFGGSHVLWVSVSVYDWQLLLGTASEWRARECTKWVHRRCQSVLYADSRQAYRSGRCVALSLREIDKWYIGSKRGQLTFRYRGQLFSWVTRGSDEFRRFVRLLLAIFHQGVHALGGTSFDLATGDGAHW